MTFYPGAFIFSYRTKRQYFGKKLINYLKINGVY